MSKAYWEVINHIAVLDEGTGGQTLELNFVSWHGSEPKYDVRWWYRDKPGRKAGKGCTFTVLQLFELGSIISKLPKDYHLIGSGDIG